MKIKKERMNKNVSKIIKSFKSKSDPMGGYTGNPIDGGKPVQDADDI